MARVLIVGAGGVAQVVAHKCAQVPEVFSEMMLASRTKAKCDRIAARLPRSIETAQLNADDVQQTVALIRQFRPDLVLNVALPYQDLPLMDACLETGVHYLDTANYEPPDVARFEYKWQWAYRERFQAKGIMALLGSGFDPGVTNVFCAHAQKHHFDEIHTLDIIDCNAGEHGQAFATNFNPEINIREITQRGRYWEHGEWIETDPLSWSMTYNFPQGIGPKKCFLLYHEELESLVLHLKGLKRARFWMTFSEHYLMHLKVLENVGMTRKAIPSVLDGTPKTVNQKIKPVIDSLSIKNLEDLKEAQQIDEKWREELYNSALYDTIYKSVTELTYEPVDYPELTTDTLKERLKRLNAKTPFNVEYNPALESVIKQYLKRRRKSLERLMGLSHYYFPMFEEALDKEYIPLEVKYLAIVESALKPRARSRVGATGLWQFMFTTGKMYGLDVSSYVDERRDPIKSTYAAAEYLAKLYKIFGDWDLALAAYNSGPGNVSKAIRRSGGYTNYWNIRPNLPRETAGYLPAFLATMYIFEFAEEHGFKPERPTFQYIETDTVRVKQMITLDQVAEVTDVSIEELQYLNPSYKLDIIPFIEDENYTLRLPRYAVGAFVANEDKIYAFAKAEFDKREKPLPQFFENDTKVRYRVKSGDYLGKIARKYGVRVSQIKRWNGLRSNNLRIGQRLTIYPRNPVASNATKTKPKTTVNTSGKKTYKVKSGDSLWSIAQKFSGVSVQNLKDWNKISSNKLKIGMTLVVSE